jgi:cellulose synthase operon protein YhjQ
MTDRKALNDPNETPEDVASLYSWANLHGAKYRDFSASRAQTREKARQRVEQAMEEERARVTQQAEAERTAETVQQAAQLAAQQASERIARDAARQAAQQAAQQAQAAEMQAAQYAQAAQQSAQQVAWQQPRTERFPMPPYQISAQQPVPASQAASAPVPSISLPSAPPAAPYIPQPPAVPAAAYQPIAPQAYKAAFNPPQYAPMREDSYTQPRNPWTATNARDNAARPAWLTSDGADLPGQPLQQNQPVPPTQPVQPMRSAVSQAPEDTLQGSRDRLTSRWFALKSVFDSANAPAETVPVPPPSRAPVLAVFSLAGGVGKTSMVATLGRALSARGERVLLVDTTPFGLLPFFFGARDQRPGVLRTFSPPAASGDASIQMVTVDPETLGPELAANEALSGEIGKHARGVGRVIVDLATASGSTTRRVLRLSPLVLVPVVPDMNSVVSVSSIDAFFQRNSGTAGKPSLPYYVLNQFDASLPLHLDVREVLREQLGDRLLNFALRRAPAVSEALAEGMTVMDYAPNSTVAEDFGNLAGWVKSLSAPASSSYRGVRWSER